MKRELYAVLGKLWEEYKKQYCLLCIMFGFGFLIALCIPISSAADLKTYMTTFLEQLRVDGLYGKETFITAYCQYSFFLLGMYFLSLSVVGAFGICLYTVFKGFCYGTVFSGVFSVYGMKTILFFLCGAVPHLLFLTPCFLTYSCFCMKNAYSVYTAKCNIKNNIIAPFLWSLLLIPGFGLSAVFQAYVEPWLVTLISTQFL